jgi:HK97 family phage major capsid protein
MNLEAMKARLVEIVAKLDEFNAIENFSDSDVETINNLNSEYETIRKNIEAKEKVEAMKNSANASNRKTTPAPVTKENVRVAAGEDFTARNGGFANAGDFLKAVVASSNGNVDRRFQNTALESSAQDGGFLIPTDFRSAILSKVQGDESLLSRTTQLVTASNNLSLPVDEVAPWDGTGIQAYWENEAAQYTDSKHKFGNVDYKLHKLTAMVKVSDELLSDAAALESYVRAKAPEAMVHKVNTAIVSGDGVGKPLGFLNSGFMVTVAKESAQVAATVNYENISKMYSRMLPMSIGKSVWLIHPQIMEQLRLMKFDLTATSPVPVYLGPQGLAGAPYGTLMGRPILPLMQNPAVGAIGDIAFVDLSYYTTVVKTAGIKSDVSTHLYFDRDLVAFKFSLRIAGSCPFKAPVETKNGAYKMSGLVSLAAR